MVYRSVLKAIQPLRLDKRTAHKDTMSSRFPQRRHNMASFYQPGRALSDGEQNRNLIEVSFSVLEISSSKMDLIKILEKTVSPDNHELESAQQFLESAAAQNLPELLTSLSNILKHGGNSPVARMQAGLQLKNALYSKDNAIKLQYQQRWLQFPQEMRQLIKKNVLDTLGTEAVRPSSAAQCVAYMACAELPHGWWPELIPCLTSNVINPNSTEMMKESTLEAVGYICQEIEPEILQPQSNEILTAIVHAMKKEEPSNHVRFAATNALLNSLEFTKANFDQEAERHLIMQVVCEATQSTDTRVRVAAMQCLVKIMSLYYIYMTHYMGPALFAHIRHEDWRYRDAAVMAFGSILEGPDPDKMKSIVESAMPMLIELLKDTSVVVRDTAAWTVGRVCEILPESVLRDTILKPLLTALLEGLEAEPRVASNVCWAFSSLAEAAYENAEQPDEDSEPETYCLSSCFEAVVDRLLTTADRTDGNQHNLRNAAYEALMELVKNSPKDCYVSVQKTTVIILNKLERVLSMEGSIQSNNDRVQFNDLQSLLCATLQSVLRKVTPEDAPKISDQIMTALLQMFQSTSGKPGGGVQEDALLAMSTLIEVLGEQFQKYMDAFKPYLLLGLKNYAEYQVCLAAVGVVGDLCRALGANIGSHCDELMMMLLENLGVRD
ncbi:importin subunit beta-1 [Plakobranchus ocellatus]|uniref:Importin subunit beta-1 n=1 Tax=Plakobranchus ocellatus TaxID=259542 RepID=A0AAV3ZXH4_9GAST|nr:importin subunit beta-1 [Plakobranchus ocellatus]